MIHPYLDLSTAHITYETLAAATPYKVAEYEHGAFFYVPPIDLLNEEEEVPTDLDFVLRFAADRGCLLIRFDADGPIQPELTTFDWLETLDI